MHNNYFSLLYYAFKKGMNKDMRPGFILCRDSESMG